MVTRAEKAIRRKSDREEKRRKRRGGPESVEDYVQDVIDSGDFGEQGPAPESSPEEEADMRLPDGSPNPKYIRQESTGGRVHLDEFAEIAESGEFSDEEPQGTFEEEEADKDTAEPMPDLENDIISATEANALASSAYEDSEVTQESHPGGGGVAPIAKNADDYTNGIVLADGTRMYRHPDGSWKRKPASKEVVDSAVRELLRPPAGYDESKDLPYPVTPEIRKETDDRAEEIYQEELGNAGQGVSVDAEVAEIDAMTPSSGGIVERVTQRDAADVEQLEEMDERTDRLGAGESQAEIAAADNPVWQQALADKDARDAAKPDIHERDKATAAEMKARFAARGPTDGYQRSAVEPPMINKDGKELGSIYYDPKLSYIENVVVDGVIIDRIVKDYEGVREGEDAKKKQEGMVWVIPSEGGFRTGDQRFAGEGPGRWVRPDQAVLMDKAKKDRRIEKDRRQAVYDKKKRTPQQIREDNIRDAREHELAMQEVEHGQDDDEKDIVKKELEIQRLQMLLAQPGLTVAQKRLYQQQLNALLGAAPVAGGAGGGEAGEAGEVMSATDANTELANLYPDVHNTLIVMADPEDGAAFEATLHLDQADTGELYIKLRELYDSTSVTPENAAAVGAFIASKLKAWHRTEIERMLNGHTEPGESHFGNDIEGTSEHDLYLFFQAIMNGQMPPEPQGVRPQGQINPPVITPGY